MTQITAKGHNPFNEPELSSSVRQGLIIGCSLVGGLIIFTLLIIYCCCNDRPQRANDVEIVKSMNKPSDVKKNTEVAPKLPPNQVQNQSTIQSEIGGGKKQDLKDEATSDQREKNVRFPYNNNGDYAKTSPSKSITSLPICIPEITLPSYAKVRGAEASDFYLNATIQ